MHRIGYFIILLIAGICDIKTRIIPDRIHIGILLLCLVSPEGVHVSGLLAALPMLIMGILSGGTGGGDIKLVAASGLFLGLPAAYMGVVIGYGLFIMMHMVIKPVLCNAWKYDHEEREQGHPLVPFLALGICISIYL